MAREKPVESCFAPLEGANRSEQRIACRFLRGQPSSARRTEKRSGDEHPGSGRLKGRVEGHAEVPRPNGMRDPRIGPLLWRISYPAPRDRLRPEAGAWACCSDSFTFGSELLHHAIGRDGQTGCVFGLSPKVEAGIGEAESEEDGSSWIKASSWFGGNV